MHTLNTIALVVGYGTLILTAIIVLAVAALTARDALRAHHHRQLARHAYRHMPDVVADIHWTGRP